MNKITFEEVSFSKHYLEDRQHRRIGQDIIRELLERGDFRYDNHNARIYYFSNQSFHNMKRSGMTVQQIEYFKKKRAVRLVVSHDKVVITAMYATKNKERIYH